MTEADVTVLDPVMQLAIELAATAKPRDVTAFVDLLKRFTEAVVREAFEHQDEVRALLNLPRVNAAPDDAARPIRLVQCPYCAADVLTITGHLPHCQRKRELDPDPGHRKIAIPGDMESRSTGAAAVVQAADQLSTKETAARETPAAPSTSSTLPAAELPTVPSREGAGSATGGAVHTFAPDIDGRCASCGRGEEGHAPLAPPAPSNLPPPQPLSGPAADGAGTSPAGPDAGAEALQPKPTRVNGGQRKLSDQICARLCRQYIEDRRANGGRKVEGWVKRKAGDHGVSEQTIYNVIAPAMAAVKEQRRVESALKTPTPRVTRMTGTRY